MRLALSIVLLASAAASAQCPPTCAGGGGPAATDCFLAFGGVSGTSVACTDGDPSCDVDGTIDGACTFGVTACTNVAVGACVATPLDAAPTVAVQGASGAEAFAAAVGQLATGAQACTEPGLVKLAIAPSQKKLKPAKVTIKTTAVAGGKKDKDKLKLVCNPARPTLAQHVQPIFTATCTFEGCHSGSFPQANLLLGEGESLGQLVNQRASFFPQLVRVKPGSLKKSYLTRSLFGTGAEQMPSGCPEVVEPVVRCLNDAEVYTILAWIQAGALP